MPRVQFVRNLDAGSFLESFLLAAVSAVLVIRVYLEMTGYPQIGGNGLHIAHMLWGGVLMLVGVVMLLAYLGKSLQHVAAIIAGAGFGTFIDELGKFITSDNNYFFEPTIALIYAIFIILFLTFRAIERQRQLTTTEHLANAVELLREAIVRPECGAREQGLALLARAERDSLLVRSLVTVFHQCTVTHTPEQAQLAAVTQRAHAMYQAFVGSRWFHRIIVGGFLLNAAGAIIALIVIIVGDPEFQWGGDPAMSFEDWGDSFSTGIATLLVVIGVIRIRASRLAAYYWFKRSTLVSIFLVQFFAFYAEQLAAVIGLVINLLILAGLDYMIGEERVAEAAPLAAGSASPVLEPGEEPVAPTISQPLATVPYEGE